jgi:hypothetical protein
MDRPEVDIRIGPDGKVTVEVKGVRGGKCLELADAIREIVGIEDSRRLTAEAHEPEGKVRIDAKVRRSPPD